MRSETSASMLVLPKYALFLTSNLCMSGRAEPSSIWDTRQCGVRCWPGVTYSASEKDLLQRTLVVASRTTAQLAGLVVCTMSRVRDAPQTASQERTFLPPLHDEFGVFEVDLAVEVHVAEALHALALFALVERLIVGANEKSERRVFVRPPPLLVRLQRLVQRVGGRARRPELSNRSTCTKVRMVQGL